MPLPAKICGRCCDKDSPPGQCITTQQLGSCFGLVSDPHCGILPIVGEQQVLVQQAPGLSASSYCSTPTGTCVFTTTKTSSAPRQATYELTADVDGLPPCNWIWYTKARAFNYDLNFPSTNRCCCQGVYHSYTCANANQVPCTTPVTCNCDIYASSHGNLTDSICVGSGTGCPSVGTYDYERDGGSVIIPPGAGAFGGNWFNPRYPAATPAEEAQDDWAASPTVLDRTKAGLSRYQDRMALRAYYWTYELAHFNDCKPIKVNGASFVYSRPDGSAGSALKYRGTDPSVTNQDATGGHPLFRYFHAFVHAQYSYRRTTEFPNAADTTPLLWQKTTPYKFHFVADGIPLFSFELDSEQREWFYQPEQYQTAVYPSAQFRLAADDIDAMLKGAAWDERTTAKDWRQEVMDDLVEVAAWGAAQSPVYSAAQDVLDNFPTVADLKLMFPCRLRGDLWDLRAIDPTTGDPTTVRPPALARVALQAISGLTNSYIDSNSGSRTGQVDSWVYDMAEPTGGIAAMSAAAAAAFKRLTRSVYFRTMPAGWDWSVAAAEADPARKPRYGWLLDRQQGDVNQGEALRWSCVVDPTSPCATDNVWCTNGQPQGGAVTNSCGGAACLDAVCDIRYGHKGYDGNVDVLIGRGEYPHMNTGGIGTCCVPAPISHHGSSAPTHATSNLCFFRHAARMMWWDTAAAPYAMREVATTLNPPLHPIDGAATCVPLPAIDTQVEASGGAASFCGHYSDSNCVANCGGTACSEYSYFLVQPDCTGDLCSGTITGQQSGLRPAGSIAGQRNAPYIGFSACVEVAPAQTTNCICPGNCGVVVPVVIPSAVED